MQVEPESGREGACSMSIAGRVVIAMGSRRRPKRAADAGLCVVRSCVVDRVSWAAKRPAKRGVWVGAEGNRPAAPQKGCSPPHDGAFSSGEGGRSPIKPDEGL